MELRNFIKTTIREYLNENVDDVTIRNIGNEYIKELKGMINNFNSNGNPKIGLFKGNNLIGGVLLDKDYSPWEYRFDVVIDERFRGEGYLKLLINKLKEDFFKDEKADQLSATVVNKELTNILINKYGFNKGEYEGDDFVWINK